MPKGKRGTGAPPMGAQFAHMKEGLSAGRHASMTPDARVGPVYAPPSGKGGKKKSRGKK